MTLNDLKSSWQDTGEYHQHIHELFCENVNNNPELKEHRDWVQNNIFGFGERSFWWLWKLICDELPPDSKMCEIGVFKCATLSLWRKLMPKGEIVGISPMNGVGTGWTDDDYWLHMKTIHSFFGQELPLIIEGYSSDSRVIKTAQQEYDLIYIDGDHSKEVALSDLRNYAPMVKKGGFLVMDDCCCDMHEPFGYFQGIQEVQDAFDEYMKEYGEHWEFIGNVVHLRVMKRK